jgi:hypothetical protein
MNDFTSRLADGMALAWGNAMTFLPKFLMFVVILVAGYFLAKFVAKLFDALLERVKFDNLVERGGVKRVLARSGLDASDLLAKLLFYGLFLLVLQFAFGIFGPNPVSDLLTRVIAYIPNLVVAAIILIIAAAIAKGVKEILAVSLGGVSYGQMIAKGAAVAIVVIGVFAALDQLAIAPNIVRGIFYAMLAVVAGSAIIAIGGGGIQPMRQRWERALNKVEGEAPRIARQSADVGEVAQQKTAEWAERARSVVNQPMPTDPQLRPHE